MRTMCVALVCCLAAFAQGGVIFDNGGPDGTGAIPAGNFDFGYRECVDDFVLDPAYPWYNVDDAEFSFIWYSGDGLDTASQVQVCFYEDTGQTAPVQEAFYCETHPITDQWYTGDYYFGRQEVRYHVDFPGVVLPSDTPFWVSLTIMDPDENGFWMISAAGYDNIFRGECYVWMEDVGYPKWTGSSYAFGTPYDLAFTLTGYGFPEPATLSLLAMGALLIRRR